MTSQREFYNPPHEVLRIILTPYLQFRLRISSKQNPFHSIYYLLDTGASVNVISSNILNQIGYTHVNFKDKITLTGIGNTLTETKGSVVIDLLIGKTIYNTKFYVMKNLSVPGIIGAEFLKKHTLFIDKNFKFIVLQKPKIYFKSNNVESNQIYKKNNYENNESNAIHYQNDTSGFQKDQEVKYEGEILNNVAFCENIVHCDETSDGFENKLDDQPCMPTELNLDIDKDGDVTEFKNLKSIKGRERIQKIIDLVNLEHLNKHNFDEIVSMIEKFNKLFFIEGDELTFTDAAIHEIETTTNIPINKRQYRMPEATKVHIDEQIDEMLKLGIIKPSKSPWNAPVLCIPKKVGADGKQKYRIVVDFRSLNMITKPFVFPIPLINEILDNIGDAQYFSSIDLKSGFYQIPINPKDAAKTAFSTSKGHYEFLRMPMGLRNSPATFQILMNIILYSIQPIKAFVYLDDIIVFGKTIEEHNENLFKILEALYQNNLKVETSKCTILKTQINYLGHTIDKHGIMPTDDNIKTIKELKRPQNVKDVRSFLGTIKFYILFQ